MDIDKAFEEFELEEALSRKDQLRLALAKSKFKKSGGKIEVQPPSPARYSNKYRGKNVAAPKTKEDEKMAQDVQDYRKKMYNKKMKKEELNIEAAFVEEFGIEERKMTDAEMAEREEIVKKMKPKLQSFKDKYGDDAEKVMYATATKQAMEDVERDLQQELVSIQEDGHTDVASAVRQCKIVIEDASQIMEKLQSMNSEESLPTWWSNKIAIASNSFNKMRDYLLVPSTTSVSVKEEVEIDEAVLVNRDYKYDGKIIKISKKNFSKVSKDFKNDTPGKERMITYDSKWGTVSVPVKFTEEVKMDESEIATSIGSGGTAGLDIGLTYKKKKEDVKKAKALRKQMVGEEVQRTTFAGKDVFIVDSDTYYNCRLGKKKYGRYEKYVGDGEVGQTIREYGLKYPRRPIILQNGESGPMLFLKYGRS